MIRFPTGRAPHGRRACVRAGVIASALVVATSASAGVVIQGTRVVYPADEREVSVRMTNQRSHPVLVEAWIECPAQTPECTIPFALTPPLFRLDPSKGQTLRLFQAPGPVPTDRESLYWLNVRDIAPKSAADDEGQLSIAFRSRIKLFHRPAKLAMQPKDAPQALRWHAQGTSVRVDNPTPYFITVTSITPEGGSEHALSGTMVSPFDALDIPLPDGASLRAGQAFQYSILNDLGGAVRLPGKAAPSP